MDIINWTLAGLLTGLMGWHFLKFQQLEKLLSRHQSDIEDLNFRHNEASGFMENQIAKTHYQMLIRMGHLKFTSNTKLAEALSHEGAREILIKHKFINRNDPPLMDSSLAKRAEDLSIALEPVLVALNFLETPL